MAITKEEYDFYTKELIKCQKEELLAIDRVKTAKENYKKAKAEFAEAKESLAGLHGMISTFISEIQRFENTKANSRE